MAFSLAVLSFIAGLGRIYGKRPAIYMGGQIASACGQMASFLFLRNNCAEISWFFGFSFAWWRRVVQDPAHPANPVHEKVGESSHFRAREARLNQKHAGFSRYVSRG